MEFHVANDYSNEFTYITDVLPDDFIVNQVEGIEGIVLSTIDQDTLKITTDDMYSDLITFETDITTLGPMATSESPEWAASMATSESPEWAASSPESLTSMENTEATLYSPESYNSMSPASSAGYETSTESLMLSSPLSSSSENSEESVTLVVSPEDVFGEQVPRKRKRGRKPKSETGEYAPPRAKKARKTKVYEIDSPFEDKEKERKRLNAVNAKRHRDIQKRQKEELEKQLENVKIERDILKKEVDSLREKEVDLSKQLEVFKAHFDKQAMSVVTLLQGGHVSFSGVVADDCLVPVVVELQMAACRCWYVPKTKGGSAVPWKKYGFETN